VARADRIRSLAGIMSACDLVRRPVKTVAHGLTAQSFFHEQQVRAYSLYTNSTIFITVSHLILHGHLKLDNGLLVATQYTCICLNK
jgi:hypothetical protein